MLWSVVFHSCAVNAGFHADYPHSTICPCRSLMQTVEPNIITYVVKEPFCALWNPGSLLPLIWPDLYVCFPLVQTLSHPPRSRKHLQQHYRASLRSGPAFSIMVFPGVLLFLRDEWRRARLLHTTRRWAGTSADKPSVCATWKTDEGVKKSPDNFIKWPQFVVNVWPLGAYITCVEWIQTENATNGQVSRCKAFRMWLRTCCINRGVGDCGKTDIKAF